MKVRIPKDFGGPSREDLMAKFAKVQEDMAAKTAELEQKEYEVSAGGGVIKLTINGKKEIRKLDISPEVVDPEDIETLSDLLCSAFTEAISVVESDSAEQMEKITSQMPSIPGLGM